jgi:hypothetical protein
LDFVAHRELKIELGLRRLPAQVRQDELAVKGELNVFCSKSGSFADNKRIAFKLKIERGSLKRLLADFESLVINMEKTVSNGYFEVTRRNALAKLAGRKIAS